MRPRPTVEDVCQEHGITRRGWYRARERAKAREDREQEAVKKVKQAREQQPKIGTRKLYSLYKETFRRLKIGRDKLFDLLRRHGLLIARKRRRTWTIHWWHRLKVYANLTRDFTPQAPNELWVSGMTYVPEGEVGGDFASDLRSRDRLGFFHRPAYVFQKTKLPS